VQLLEKLAIDPIISQLEEEEASMATYRDLPKDKRQDYVRAILKADIANYTFPANFIERNIHFFRPPTQEELKESSMASEKLSKYPSGLSDIPNPEVFSQICHTFVDIPVEGDQGETQWTRENIHAAIETSVDKAVEAAVRSANSPIGEQEEGMMRKSWKRIILTYIRWAVVCRRDGPDTTETVKLLGREDVLNRIKKADEMYSEERREK